MREALFCPSKEAGEIARVLGLPRETTGLTLDMRVGEFATLTATMHVTAKHGALVEVLRRFELVEKPQAATVPAAKIVFADDTHLVCTFEALIDVLPFAPGPYRVEHIQLSQAEHARIAVVGEGGAA